MNALNSLFPTSLCHVVLPYHFGGRLLPGNTSVQHIHTHSQLARGGHIDHSLPPPHQFGSGESREGGTRGRRRTHYTSSTTATLRGEGGNRGKEERGGGRREGEGGERKGEMKDNPQYLNEYSSDYIDTSCCCFWLVTGFASWFYPWCDAPLPGLFSSCSSVSSSHGFTP